MRARWLSLAVVLCGAAAGAAGRSWVVTWGRAGAATDEQRVLMEQVELRLRNCHERETGPELLLAPNLEVFPRALRLNVVVSRSVDRKVLGSISTKAAGASRDAQLKAIVTHVCREAGQLE